MIFVWIIFTLYFQNGGSQDICPCKQVTRRRDNASYPHRYSLTQSSFEINPEEGVELTFNGEAKYPFQASFQAFDKIMKSSIGQFVSLNDRMQVMNCENDRDSIKTVKNEFKSMSESFIWIARGFVGDAYFYSTINVPSKSIQHQCQLAAKVRVRVPQTDPNINLAKMENNSVIAINSSFMMYDMILVNQTLDADGIALSPNGWPNGVVPYEVEQGFSEDQMNMIARAMEHIQSGSCVKFIKKAQENDFVRISPDSQGCQSQVGFSKNTGAHKLLLDPTCNTMAIAHELLHSLGFIHEQDRPDRDQYVRILWENILDPSQFFRAADENEEPLPPFCDENSGATTFDDCIKNARVTTLDLPYDYNSIMHYGPRLFARDPQRDTMEVLMRNFTGRLGQRERLSDLDFEKLNTAYQCDQTTGGPNPGSPRSSPRPNPSRPGPNPSSRRPNVGPSSARPRPSPRGPRASPSSRRPRPPTARESVLSNSSVGSTLPPSSVDPNISPAQVNGSTNIGRSVNATLYHQNLKSEPKVSINSGINKKSHSKTSKKKSISIKAGNRKENGRRKSLKKSRRKANPAKNRKT